MSAFTTNVKDGHAGEKEVDDELIAAGLCINKAHVT